MKNIAISIDESELKLKIMFRKSGKALDYVEYDIEENLVKPVVKYEKIIEKLSAFSKDTGIHSGSIVYVIPDKYVACDFVEIPTFSTKKLNETLNLQMSTRYPGFDKMRIAYVPIGTYNVNSTYFAYMIKNELIFLIASAFKHSHFPLKYIAFESAMTANAACAYPSMRTIYKRDTFLLADVKANFTRLTIVKDNKLAGFTVLPYGENLLSCEKKIELPPPILTSNRMFEKGLKSSFELCEQTEGDSKDNILYLLDAVENICETVAKQYHIEISCVKYNLSKQYAPLLEQYVNDKNLKLITLKSKLAAEHLELFGALNPKQFCKGLLF